MALAKNSIEPTGEDHGTVTTTDLSFEAVAQEDIAMYTLKPYETNAYQNVD